MSEQPEARLIVLCSGGPVPNSERFGSAYILETAAGRVMVDCGPAAVFKMAKLGLHPLDIDYLFLTHHHFDHMADLGTFMMTRWDHSTGKENPLRIFGPPNTRAIVERLIGPDGAFAFDLHARTEHHLSKTMHSLRGGSLPRPAPRVQATDIGPGTAISDPNLTVKAVRTEHVQPYHDSLAYRIDAPGASVVFTGDAQPCDHLVDLATGATTLVSLCGNFQSKLREKGVEQGQTGTLGAAELAAECRVRELFLVHMSAELTAARDEALAEIGQVFDGRTVMTDELESYSLASTVVPVGESPLRGTDTGEFSHIVRH